LNYYENEKNALGWHKDDSHPIDHSQPIAVVSFGAERQIWVKHESYKGEIPDNDRYTLGNGSLFIMPAGYQTEYMHKIPKHDRPCGARVSLTFRRYADGI
jgi:alkylated DNA repair dioxygenase AlkB